jgi:gamma-glutamyltranspeptidase/glutathione hydrolase
MLNILEGYDLAALGAENPTALHLMLSAMQRAFADRALYLGDPDRVRVPVKGLTAKSYAALLRAGIDVKHARASATIHPGEPAPPPEGENTTHFSVVDRFGNAVANTYTLNFSYGLGMVAQGTGVLLNNELDDFAAKPEAPNAYGLTGFEANAPAPGKRPLSSMTPTIVLENGKPILVTGSPGGSRIPTTVLQVIVNTIDFRLDIAAAVAHPRVHHQWLPDAVIAEPQLAASALEGLRALGYTVRLSSAPTSANSIAVTPEGLRGAADPRTRGALAAGD